MPLKSYLAAILALCMLTFSACRKKNSKVDPILGEEGLKISLENVLVDGYTASPGDTYTFLVKINSSMPEDGVIVEVVAVTDPGGVLIPQELIAPTKDGAINVTLTGLEPIRTVKVTVTVTSVGKSNNVTTQSFWITNKEEQ